ncbi:hypothetical protein KA005_64015 [bacterium]|nr:hypothetical protein [bacterium]
MKTLLLLIIAYLISIPVYAGYGCADQINNISGLKPEIRQGMIVSCEAAKLKATQSVGKSALSPVSVDNLTEWGLVAKQFAEAIGIAASELGVAVNEFIKTPAGIMVIVGIFWTIMGASVVSFLVGVVLETLTIVFCYYSIKRMMTKNIEYKYDHRPILWGFGNKKYVVEKKETEWGDADFFMAAFFCVVGVLLTWIITYNLLLM